MTFHELQTCREAACRLCAMADMAHELVGELTLSSSASQLIASLVHTMAGQGAALDTLVKQHEIRQERHHENGSHSDAR